MSARRLFLLFVLVTAMLALPFPANAMARKSAARYGGRCESRALWHNDTSKSSDH